MSAKIIRLPRPAEPSIRRVLDGFLEAQRKRLAPRTLLRYVDVIDLLRTYLDDYAGESLSGAEAALFERHCDPEGEEHREFCELFGPEKIVDNLGGFLGHFMIRKVMAGEDFLRAAGTVTKKLSKWLAEQGHISLEDGDEATETATDAARDLPRAERAARILHDASDRLGIDPAALDDDDYSEFEHFTIARVEAGQLWLEVWEGGAMRERGPIPAPESATELLRPGWTISCALGRVRRSWRLLEVANVYPA